MGKHSAKAPQQAGANEGDARPQVQAPLPDVPRGHHAGARTHHGTSAVGVGAAPQGAGNPNAPRYSRAKGAEEYIEKRQRRGRHHVLRAVLVTLVALVVAGGAAVAAYVHHINSTITAGVDDKLRDTLVETKDPGDPFYMLLLGIDKDEERAESRDYGKDYSAYRTDTIILARVDPRDGKVTLISIPRDTLVDLGSNGKQKINAAYSFGGAAYATKVVSEFAGVDISHYAEIDMDGFAKVVDAIGGVTVDLPVEVKDPKYTGLDLPAGKQKLDGRTAALLGRARHAYDSYGGGDFYRAANQRMLIGAVITKVMKGGASTIVPTVTTLSSYVTTDMDVTSIASLASSFKGIDVEKDVYSGQCPTISKYVNNTWYEICDTTAWKKIMDRVDKGLPPYKDASQDFTAGVAGSVGVSTSTGDDSSSSSTSANGAAQVSPEYTGTVLVLNGTSTAGVAGNGASTLTSAGFAATTNDAPSLQAKTTVYYNGDAQAKAAGVVKTLGLSAAPVQNDGSWDTSSDVVVVFGADWIDGSAKSADATGSTGTGGTASAGSNAVTGTN